MAGEVDAHGLGGHLIVPDGLEGPAVGGVDEQQDAADAQRPQQEGHEGGQAQGKARQLDVEAGEGGEALEGVGAVGDGAQFVPLEDGPDDLAEAQGGDGQIVGLQPQHRQSDQPRHGGRHDAGEDQRQQHADHKAHGAAAEELRQGEVDGGALVDIVHTLPGRHRDGQDGVGVGAQQHEAGLAQREQAGEAVEQVHGGSHHRVHRALFQHGEEHVGGLHGVLQQDHQGQQCHGAQEDHQRAPLAFLFLQHS